MTSCKERLFVCGLLLSIFCITLGFAAPEGSNLPNDAPCTTNDNAQGTCIELKRCKSFTAMKLPQTGENTAFIHNNRCGGNINEPKICCANSPALPVNESNSFKLRASTTKPADCGKYQPDDVKMIGIRPAQLGSWPWMVALGYRRSADQTISFRCGASLIADEWLLTAAHCAVDTSTSRLTSARLGDLNLDDKVKDDATPMDISIDKTYIHPEYQNDKRNYDIALARLNKPVEFTRLIQPICLLSGATFEEDKYYVRKRPYAIGWGMTENGIPTALMQDSVNVRNLKNCSQTYSEIGKSFTDNILCAEHFGRDTYTCQGDSGGPLIFVNTLEIRYYLGGVVSAESKCGKEYPGLYMKVAKFIPWINEVTGLNF